MEHEQLEQRELGARQVDHAVAALHLMGRRVELEVPEAQHLPAGAQPRAPQQRPQPREQLVEGEGLHDVVVRAGVEARDPVGDRVPRGQHQDRRAVTARAHRRHTSRPSTPGIITSSTTASVPSSRQRRQGLFAVRGDRDLVALQAQRALQRVAHRGLVVDNQDLHAFKFDAGN